MRVTSCSKQLFLEQASAPLITLFDLSEESPQSTNVLFQGPSITTMTFSSEDEDDDDEDEDDEEEEDPPSFDGPPRNPVWVPLASVWTMKRWRAPVHQPMPPRRRDLTSIAQSAVAALFSGLRLAAELGCASARLSKM